MTYIGDNKIHKFGNGNRIYLGDRLIYQLLQQPEEYKLPDIPFFFNFNAKNYSNGKNKN